MPERLVSFCTTVKNRGSNLGRLCGSLAAMHSAQPFELVVADYESTDARIGAMLDAQPFASTWLTLCGGHFNRAQGLNVAAEHAAGGADDLLFFIDVDMLVPADFCTRIRDEVVPGRAWFPICYSLHRGKRAVVRGNSRRAASANGWWRKEGKGMCGFTHADFAKVLWNARIGVTYGREDGDICQRASKRGDMQVSRANCDGLFHMWHPIGGGYRTRHHRKGGGEHRGRNRRPANPQPVVPTVSVRKFRKQA